MDNVKVYFHGDFTLDCYTVVIGQEVYAMSEHPNLPHATNMHICGIEDFHPELDKEISLSEVPVQVMEGIKKRMETAQ